MCRWPRLPEQRLVRGLTITTSSGRKRLSSTRIHATVATADSSNGIGRGICRNRFRTDCDGCPDLGSRAAALIHADNCVEAPVAAAKATTAAASAHRPAPLTAKNQPPPTIWTADGHRPGTALLMPHQMRFGRCQALRHAGRSDDRQRLEDLQSLADAGIRWTMYSKRRPAGRNRYSSSVCCCTAMAGPVKRLLIAARPEIRASSIAATAKFVWAWAHGDTPIRSDQSTQAAVWRPKMRHGAQKQTDRRRRCRNRSPDSACAGNPRNPGATCMHSLSIATLRPARPGQQRPCRCIHGGLGRRLHPCLDPGSPSGRARQWHRPGCHQCRPQPQPTAQAWSYRTTLVIQGGFADCSSATGDPNNPTVLWRRRAVAPVLRIQGSGIITLRNPGAVRRRCAGNADGGGLAIVDGRIRSR